MAPQGLIYRHGHGYRIRRWKGEKASPAVANINNIIQATANKRLDFELARLKNCGELMKAGVMFHPKSQYAAVCADVVLVNPPGVVEDHTHSITPTLEVRPNGDANSLKEISIGNP